MNTLRTKLWTRLTLAFVFVALVGVTLVAVLANRATSIGFQRYLQAGEFAELWQLQEDLGAYYAREGDWSGANTILRNSGIGPQGGGTGYFLRVVDSSGQIVASRGGQNRTGTDFALEYPISADGRQVGTLLAEPAGGGGRSGEQYLTAVNQAIFLSGLVALVAALLLGLFLARRITKPIRQMAEATHALAAGDLEHQVPITSSDELGRLAEDFNKMASALALSEKQRRQLLADTAHDLRTPISVIQSHLEAMLDDVFPMTQENLAGIHEETLHLSRLVEDVRILSLAETGQLPLEKGAVDLYALVSQVVSAFTPLAQADDIALESNLAPVPTLSLDEARIHQVLANLISNGLRYAPLGKSQKPTVQIALDEREGQVRIMISDNGPGLTAEQQARVFDRFWRSDSSRDRQKGGSGLGLTISKSIVEAHNGRIAVHAAPGQGTAFTITFPH